VKSEAALAKGEQEGYAALMRIPGIGQVTAERLFHHGLKSVAMIAAAPLEMLSTIPGVGEKAASHWIEEAAKLLEEQVGGLK
jgi:Holliday junction resolvasome RuvABC DNA-binding subunit